MVHVVHVEGPGPSPAAQGREALFLGCDSGVFVNAEEGAAGPHIEHHGASKRILGANLLVHGVHRCGKLAASHVRMALDFSGFTYTNTHSAISRVGLLKSTPAATSVRATARNVAQICAESIAWRRQEHMRIC